jgi:hypothetical protein
MGIAALILEAAVVVLSFLTGYGAIGGPVIVRIALAFCALFIIPGRSLSALVFRSRASLVEAACRIFSMGIVFASIVVCVGFVPGVSYRMISLIASILALALAFLARGMSAPAESDPELQSSGSSLNPRRRLRWISLLLGVVLFGLCVAVFSGTGELGWSTDSLDHVSFVGRSVESGVLFPRDSYYRDGDGISLDPRKGLWHPVLSLWTYQTHAPAYRVWRDTPAFLSFFAVCSFLFFAVQFCGSMRCMVLSFVFFLLFYGGGGISWLTKIGFSRNVAQIVLWIDLAFLFTYYRTGKRAHLFVGALLACAGAAIHVVFAMLLGVTLAGVFLYVTLLRGGAAWRGAFWRSVPLQLAAMAIPLAIRAPAASVISTAIHTHMQGMLVFSPNLAIVDPTELIVRYGPVFFFALFATPLYPFLAERAGRRGLAFMLFIVPVLVVLDPLIASALERRIGYLHYRILDAAPLIVMLAFIVGGLAERLVMGGTGAGGSRRIARPVLSVRGAIHRVVAGGVLAVFIAYPLRMACPRVAESIRALVEKPSSLQPPYASLLVALGGTVPDRSVIASDPVTSYILSAYTDYYVTVILDQHCSPADTSAIERLREARNLMSPVIPLSASRAWLDRNGADYVLINDHVPERADFFNSFLPAEASRTREKFLECPSLLASVLDLDGFHLFRVRRDSSQPPAEEACSIARTGAVPCAPSGESSGAGRDGGDGGTDVGAGISLVNLTVDNYLLGAGDTLAGHFCWKAVRNEGFGLPLDVIIRIDAPFPKGALYREWYGKQYRRIMERKGEGYYRLTWRTRLMSGPAYPDMWEAGRSMMQRFALPLPASIVPGPYEVRVKVIRAPYLENRRVADYLSNDDSLQGVPVGMIYLREQSRNGISGRADARQAAHRGG